MMSSLTHVVPRVSVLLLFTIQLSAAMHMCNLAKQYIVRDNSGKSVSCLKCPRCKTGSEPGIPCGSKIGINEKSGLCTFCKSGTYSDSDDVHPCKPCKSEMCFKHQIIEGTCTIKRDTSHCLDKCEKAYVMNKDQTACDVAKPRVITTTDPLVDTGTTAASDLSTKLTTYSSVSDETKMNPVAIIFIVLFAVAVIAIALGIFVYWRYTKSEETPPVKDEVKEKTNSTELLSADSNSSMNEDVNNENNIDQQVQNSPANCKGVVRTPSMTYLSNFNEIPSTLYLTICVTFDTGPDGKNWRALAGWLDFNVQEIRRFELKEKNERTDRIIQSWEAEVGNDIDKFVEILIANKMTSLAQKISKAHASRSHQVTLNSRFT